MPDSADRDQAQLKSADLKAAALEMILCLGPFAA